MHGIDGADAVPVMPTPSEALSVEPQYFQEGNPRNGKEATIVTADWLNMVQSELLNIVRAANITPEKATHDQVLKAIRLLVVSTVIENANDIKDLFPGGAYLHEPDTLALRNALGCTQVNDPRVSKDAVNKGWVEDNFSPINIAGLFTQMKTLTTSGTFTAPHDGVYKVTLIGGGGGGGKGGGANGGGTGGAAGGATSFASFGRAAGGGGGGGGGDACGGGGGGAGIVVTIYVWLTAGQHVAYTIGAGGTGASVMNASSTGQSASGTYGGAGNMRNGGGLGGTGGGTGGSGTSNVPGRSCGGGGTGASNGTLYGGGGGGGGGAYGAEFTNTFSATAGPGAAKGAPGNDANGGNGGTGGNGAIIIEYA